MTIRLTDFISDSTGYLILSKDVDPTSTDDGYTVGTMWVNNTSNTYFVCIDNTPENAIWSVESAVDDVSGRTGSITLSASDITNFDTEVSNNVDVDANTTKLAGIESGATADQSKTDIDALNIDADTLDSHNSSYFATSGHTHHTFDYSTTISGATVFDEIDVTNGIVTNVSTRSLTAANIGAAASSHSHSYNSIIGTDSDINSAGSTIIDNIYVTDGVITSMGTRAYQGYHGTSLDGYEIGARHYVHSGFCPVGGIHYSGGRMYAYGGDSNNWVRMYGWNVADGTNVVQVQVAASARIALESGGNGRFDGGADIGSADYAEMFEWGDGNPDDDDRVGRTVVLVNEKIRFALPDDDPTQIIGSVSGAPGIVGDSAYLNWKQLDLVDDFGRKIWGTTDIYEFDYVDGEGETQRVEGFTLDNIKENLGVDFVIPNDAIITPIPSYTQNPDYDPDLEYIPRADRKEWDPIGLVGKLRILKGEPMGTNWIKMRDITDNIEEWLIR